MPSKEKVQYNDDEEVNTTYNKIVEKSAVQTGCLDGFHKPWYLILTLPLRITEFVTTLLLFGIVIYLSTEVESGLRNTTTIFMITLTSSYLFFSCIQIIAHFTGSNLPEYPFLFFNFLGMCFYMAAAFSILYTAPTKSWGRLASFLLSFLISGFHTASVLIVLIFWRERFRTMPIYNMRGSNRVYPSTQMLYTRASNGFDAATVCHCEMATSVSHYGVLEVVPDDAAIKAHGSRKIETGHRRSYVDRHCSCPEVTAPKAIEVQTECGKISTEETQTCLEVKEIIIQTLSKCELCNRQMIDPEPTPVTPVPSEEIPPESPPLSVILGAPQSTPPTQSIYSPLQIPKAINQATQSGCIMPCPNATTPTPFYIIPGGLGLRDGMNPCCGACNCGHTSKLSSQLHFCPPKEPEPMQLASPPPPTPPCQSSWTTACEARIVETGPCEKSSSHDRDLVVNPSDKTARRVCPGTEPCPQKMQRIKVATKVGCGAQQMIDYHSSSILIQKNKKTQTKIRTHVCASEESGDEKDDKKPCTCRRIIQVKSQLKEGNKMQRIDEDFGKDKDYCEIERTLAITESNIKSNKRTKPLYRESIEDKKPEDDVKNENNKERTEIITEKESKTYYQSELIKEVSTKEVPRRFKSKVSPSPSQTRLSQASLASKKSEEIPSKPVRQRSRKDHSGDDNSEDATVRIEDVTDDHQRHSTQSPVNYLPPPTQSRSSREHQIDQLIKAYDKEIDEKQNEFPEEF